MFSLRPHIHRYAWGNKDRKSSLVARFDSTELAGPHAEAWFGAHPNGMAIVTDADGQQITCASFLSARDLTLPFQAKLLDIGDPLSIQLHPSRGEAVRLYNRRPDSYPDDVPKFEGAVVLEDTELLLGWRPEFELRNFLRLLADDGDPADIRSVTELSASDLSDNEFYQELACRVLAVKKSNIRGLHQRLIRAAEQDSAASNLDLLLGALIAKAEHAEDYGLLFACLLNYLTLKPSDAVFIPVGVPHAYLSGCVAEIMYLSDNVIRLGLTPKAIDYEEALRCLNYDSMLVTDLLRRGISSDSGSYYEIGAGLSVATYEAGAKSKISTLEHAEVIVFFDGSEGTIQGEDDLLDISPFSSLLLAPNSRYQLSLKNGRAVRFLKTN